MRIRLNSELRELILRYSLTTINQYDNTSQFLQIIFIT